MKPNQSACRAVGRRTRGPLRVGLSVAILASVTFGTWKAHADNPVDTVLLANGGRVRGTVMEEDPQKGTSIRLLDGTIKRLAAGEVKQVVYASEAQVVPPPASAPVPLPTPPNPVPAERAPVPAALSSIPAPLHAAPPASSTPAHEESPSASGLELGVRTGYAIPLGTLAGTGKLNDLYSGAVPIWLDAGYHLKHPNLYLGMYFQYGFGLVNGHSSFASGCRSGGVSCSGSLAMVGVDVQYHFVSEGRFDPWAGLGVGYEFASINESAGGQSGGYGFNGFQFVNVQAGLDYRVVPQFGLGPFAAFSLGEYSSCSSSGPGTFGSCALPQKGLHEWITLGIRGVFDIGI